MLDTFKLGVGIFFVVVIATAIGKYKIANFKIKDLFI